MGNGNSTIEDKARMLEKNLLRLSGLELGTDLHILDVKIDFLGENYIHTIRCGDDNKEVLVLIHGYGGSSIMFYQMLRALSRIYKVYCIDLLGMGLSSRPDFPCINTEETIDFFVDSIDQWRISLNIDKFTMGGHSFGGYIACQYSTKYSKNVKNMLLLSPLGFSKRDTICDLEDEDYINTLGFVKRQFHKLRIKFWKDKLTVSQLANKYAWIFGFLIRRFFTKRLKISSEAGETLWDFLMLIYKLKESSEIALHYIVNPNLIAFYPLEECLWKNDIPTVVFFGENDWMDDSGAKRMLRMSRKNFELIYIKASGHQITMENPNELLAQILTTHLLGTNDLEININSIADN